MFDVPILELNMIAISFDEDLNDTVDRSIVVDDEEIVVDSFSLIYVSIVNVNFEKVDLVLFSSILVIYN